MGSPLGVSAKSRVTSVWIGLTAVLAWFYMLAGNSNNNFLWLR